MNNPTYHYPWIDKFFDDLQVSFIQHLDAEPGLMAGDEYMVRLNNNTNCLLTFVYNDYGSIHDVYMNYVAHDDERSPDEPSLKRRRPYDGRKRTRKSKAKKSKSRRSSRK